MSQSGNRHQGGGGRYSERREDGGRGGFRHRERESSGMMFERGDRRHQDDRRFRYGRSSPRNKSPSSREREDRFSNRDNRRRREVTFQPPN